MVRTWRKIPAEWERYDPIGSVVGGSRLFPFKTPLRAELQNRIDKGNRFTTLDLFRKMAESGRSIGLVVNCTNTNRYYDQKDVEGIGVAYKEILCPGRGFLERADIVKKFNKTIDEFLAANSENDLLVGVHCSNGVNRAGYLICSYLIIKLGWSSHDALNAFESARGYPIERGAYIQALHKADRERRSKNHPAAYEQEFEDTSSTEYGKRSKKRKRKMSEEEEPPVDESLTSQMMQQFFNMEKHFKQVAETAASQSFVDDYSLPAAYSSASQIYAVGQSDPKHPQQQQEEEEFEEEEEDVSDEDEDDNMSPNIDFASMGKVDIKEPPSKSQQRRVRRQKREKMFAVMKRGRFWEINNMQKEMQ